MQSRKGQSAILRADFESLVEETDGVERAAMIEHHAFGVARRSRGEEHISEVVGRLDRFQRTCVEA